MLIAMRNAMMAGGAKPYWGLTFTAEQAGSTVRLTSVGTAPPAVSLAVSTDGGATWTPYTIGATITLSAVGDSVCFAAAEGATNPTFGGGAGRYYHQFVMSGRIAASGDIRSLLSCDETAAPSVETTAYTFCRMFLDCTSLISAPDLLATTMAHSGYRYMFMGCTSLTVAPDLPATTLATWCYGNMFNGCTSLTAAPHLPATTLASHCYRQMFVGCSSLALVSVAFESFSNVTDWLSGVAATGTFRCPRALGTSETITRGVSACPDGWTVVNID